MYKIPDPNQVLPTEYGMICFLRNVIQAPNIFVGDFPPEALVDFLPTLCDSDLEQVRGKIKKMVGKSKENKERFYGKTNGALENNLQ